MGPTEILKMEIERQERGRIMMEFENLEETTREIRSRVFPLDKRRDQLELIGSYILGLFFGVLSLFFLYGIIRIMR